jgi:hypothetical protein
MIGQDCGDCLAPILPLEDEQRHRLREVLIHIGLLNNEKEDARMKIGFVGLGIMGRPWRRT